MNLLFPRSSSSNQASPSVGQDGILRRIGNPPGVLPDNTHASCQHSGAPLGGLRIFSLLAVCAIFLTGALGRPQDARAQSQDARAQSNAAPPGSQPAAVPAPAVPETGPKAQAEAPKVDPAAADKPKADAPKDPPASPAGSAKGPAPAAAKRYIIGSNDVLSVKVWNQPQISGMVDVHLDGLISLPLVGEIKAEGLTELQLKDVITRRLGEVLTAPEVDVSVVRVNSKHYRVYGGVGRPGPYPLVETTTIMDAISAAGGLKEFAKPKIEIRRGKQTLFFNTKDYLKGKNMDKNTNLELQDGDEIIVPE